MKKNRLIPVLILKNGFLVQSKQFSRFQNIGNPISAVKRLSEWAADELIYLDISRDDHYDMRRDDLRHSNLHNVVDIIKDVSRYCHMPITVGGKIRSLEDIAVRLASGADKVAINAMVLRSPLFITDAAKEFGSQCIIVSMDAKMINGSNIIMSEFGKKPTQYSPDKWAKICQDSGAGEILVNSIDRDGARCGYDMDLISLVADSVKIPVIACGGVGEWSHFAEAFDNTKADAVAAANIFHYTDQSVYLAKKYLYDNGYNVRRPDLILDEIILDKEEK